MTENDTVIQTSSMLLTPAASPGLTPGQASLRLISVCMAVMTAIAVGFTAWAAKEFLIPIAVAFLIAVMASPIARVLEKRRCSPLVAAAIVTLSLIAAIVGLGWALTPDLVRVSEDLPKAMRTMERRIEAIREAVRPLERASNEIQAATRSVTAAPSSRTVTVEGADPLSLLVTSIGGIAAQGVAAFLLVFFLLSQRRKMKTIVVAMARANTTRKRLIAMFNDIKTRISTYLLAIAVTGVALGVASAGALYLLGFPNPVLWGVAVTIFNFVPYAGPIAVQLAALLVGAMLHTTLGEAIAPALSLWALSFIEGQIVSPWFVARRVVLNPLSVFVAIVFGGWIWGVVGAVVAVPALIVGASVVQHWWAPCATSGRERVLSSTAPWRGWAMQGALQQFNIRRDRNGAMSVRTTDI